MKLNDTILEKERHIIELQEMCREQGELVQAKAKAFHIIQQKLLVFLKSLGDEKFITIVVKICSYHNYIYKFILK